MLHVLRHYLPIRKLLLLGSELAILTAIVFAAMSAHLWFLGDGDRGLLRMLAHANLSEVDARWRCLFSAVMVSLVAQLGISLNELYDFRVSSSRFDRAARFVSSAGAAIGLNVAVLVLTNVWGLERAFEFPGLHLSQRVVRLTFALMVCFVLLYLWRNLFHFLLRRWNFNERILIIGAGRAARRLVDELMGRPDIGYEIAGILSEYPVQATEEGMPPANGAPAHPGRRASDRRAGDREDRRRSWRVPEPSPEAVAMAAAGGATLARAPGASGESTARALFTPEPEAAVAEDHSIQPLLLEPELEAEPGDGEETLRYTHRLVEWADRLDVDSIVVALKERRGTLPTEELLECRLAGLVVEDATALYERVTGKIAVEAMRPSYLIFNKGFRQSPLSELAKRVLDFVLAAVGIVLTAPLMILTAIAVRLDSPGPILFRQERVGRHGKTFTLLKFRSMRADAEAQTGPVWASQNDPRITQVGRFLRRSRLDEVPQLFNILSGQMSLVGPRPERPHFVEDLSKKIPYYGQRHIVKPGLTGWAQINYPYGNTIEDAIQKLQYDLFYIKSKSLILDLSILFNTIKTVVLRKGT